MTTLYGWLLALLMIGGMGTVGYFYYTNTEATIAALNQETTAQRLAIISAEKTISQMVDEREATEENYSALVARSRVAEEYQDGLLDILHKHNLTNLASKKPGLIETRINEGTKNVLSDLERTTTDQ
jgi:hypothetical protein